jgi:LEA14-like dessication related protein
MRRREGLSLLLVPVLGAGGCAKPQPPTLRPRSARVTGTSRYAVELSVELEAHNPNSFPLTVNRVTAQCELKDGAVVGTASSAAAFTLPAQRDESLEVKLSVELASFQLLVPFAFKLKPMPYRLRGSAKVGGNDVSLDVPFSVEGEITPQELLATGLRNLAIGGPKE